jgi:HD-GYP domain-containing protein (c-di-GMP phosphodiesterase class II)
MEFLDTKTKEILFLAKNIINRKYKKDNWLSLLDNLSHIFKTDGSFIGLWNEGYIELKYSSIIIKDFLKNNSTSNLQRVNIKNRKIFREKLIKNGFIAIKDYQKYEFTLSEWKNIGLQSLLAVIIKSSKKIYGSLHIVSISKKIEFNSSHIEALTIIANIIASELEKEALVKKIKEEKNINEQYVKLINSIALENKIPEILDDWMTETLHKIKILANAQVVSFILPSENIYATINDTTKIGYDNIQESPLYDVWEKNITNITEYSDFTKNTKLHQCNLNISNIILIPTLSNNKALALLCLGFSTPTKLAKQKIELIQTILKYFSSLIYTYRNISKISSQLSETEEGLIKAFVSSMEAKDLYTKGHSQHVAIYAKNIGKTLGLNEKEQDFLYNAGLLHDIGKIGIPDNILLKPEGLSSHEYNIMKLHPLFSYEIVKNIPKFNGLAKCILYHHEKLDGSGYPEGLSDNQIEIGARILAIADIFDALTTKRPYRTNLTPDKAIEILKKEAIDQDILSKVETVLKDSYLNELSFQETFIPTKLETTRKEMLIRDYTTGLYRRNALVKFLNSYIEKGNKFSLFMVDIKNISYINYKYGVEIADKIIVFVSDELNKVSKIDALSRTNSDVFMFIYKGSNPEVFKKIVSHELKQGIIDKIKQKSCVIDKEEANRIIGCHITYTLCPEEAETAEELIYKCITKKKEMVKNI